MPADRPRRTTTSRDAAEAAFKAATTKPAELPPKGPTIPMPRSLSLCELTGTFLIIFKKQDQVGKTGLMRRCER
jgi:hypothetical protein